MTVITNMQRLYPDTDTGLCKWGIALAMPQVRCPAFAPPSFNLHTYTSTFRAVPHFVNHNSQQQQCHQKSLLPPCHRARSQPATHRKKACY